MGLIWGHLGVNLGSVCDRFWHILKLFLNIFGMFWRHFGVTLGLLWGYCWVTLGSFFAYKGHFESLWCHVGLTLASLVDPNGRTSRKYIFFPCILRPQGWSAENESFQGGGLGPPGRDLERGKPLLRRRGTRNVNISRRLRPQGLGGFASQV